MFGCSSKVFGGPRAFYSEQMTSRFLLQRTLQIQGLGGNLVQDDGDSEIKDENIFEFFLQPELAFVVHDFCELVFGL